MSEEDLGRPYRPAEPGVSPRKDPVARGTPVFRRFLLLLLLTAASRLPFIGNGYGSDADAWRVAWSAHHLAETGEYRPSRFPGVPLYEILMTPFVALAGAPASNATSIAAMLLVLLVWRAILRGSARQETLLLFSLAFTPILWKNSATTMDYLWSLLFILLSYERLLHLPAGDAGRPALAGLLMGLAAGFRPSNIVMVLPLITLMTLRQCPRRSVAAFLTACAVTTTAAFLPPILSYGLPGWFRMGRQTTTAISLPPVERLQLFGYRSVTVLGIAASVLIAVIVILRHRALLDAVRERDAIVWSSLAGVLAPLALACAYPLEREYLIPLIPFLFLLLDRVASRRELQLLTAAVVLTAFVTPDIVAHHGVRGSPGFNLHAGVLQEFEEKKAQIMRDRAELDRFAAVPPAVVMTGTGPAFWLENPHFVPDTGMFWRQFPEVVVSRRQDPGVYFIDALSHDELAGVRKAGYRVYCYAPAQAYLESVLHYRMEEAGVIVAGPRE